MEDKKLKSKKLDRIIEWLLVILRDLPFDDNTFDAITVAFGVRNFETLEKGLSRNFTRIKTGWYFCYFRNVCTYKSLYKQGYKFHSKVILPTIGKLFSKDKAAYKYLSESASVFPYGEALNNILRKIGFINVKTCHKHLV